MSFIDGCIYVTDFIYKKEYEKEALELMDKLGDQLNQIDKTVKEVRYYILESKYFGVTQLYNYFAALYETRPLYDHYTSLMDSIYLFLKAKGRILKLVPKKIEEAKQWEKSFKENERRYSGGYHQCPMCGNYIERNILKTLEEKRETTKQHKLSVWQGVLMSYQQRKEETEAIPADQYHQSIINNYQERIAEVKKQIKELEGEQE